MSRIANAWRALMGAGPEVAPPLVNQSSDTQEAGGVLFGLDPPEGCRFRVELSRGGYWHVQIFRGDYYVCGGCERAGYRTDEDVIADAAREALKLYSQKAAVEARKSKFEGCYPPKRAKGAK